MASLYIHLRVHRWVIWWVSVGVVGGAIAVINILGHQLSSAQDRILIALGVAHWLLGGIVCWASESVEVEAPPRSPSPPVLELLNTSPESEYHPPSDFLLPGNRKSLLPWKH
jgi:hypothetical protein